MVIYFMVIFMLVMLLQLHHLPRYHFITYLQPDEINP